VFTQTGSGLTQTTDRFKLSLSLSLSLTPGIAFAPDGSLYVSSYEDSRVVRFNVSEAARSGSGSGGIGGGGNLKPWEAVRAQQNVVAPCSHNITVI
jgi:hypothetical protein